MSVTQILSDVFSPLNTYIWYFAFVFLIGLGIIFTLKLKGMQILKVDENAKLALNNPEEPEEEKDQRKVSSFEAFCIGMGARIGVGNIAGVATAIVTGGPGAVFWMWVFAILGSSTSFMESAIAQLYKKRKSDGGYHGGPAYYATYGLKNRSLGIFLAILIFITFGIGFVGVQASNCASALCNAFSFEYNQYIFGALIALGTALVILKGMKRIAKFSARVVPIMAFLWILFAGLAICMNFEGVPLAIEMIFNNAFQADALLGGGLGTAIMIGLKRGVFSNEAGLGSVANIAATANVRHPAKQGLIQSFGVLVDTLVVCSITAFVVLSYGPGYLSFGVQGAPLVQNIMATTAIGEAAPYLIAIFLFVFAFTSMIGYYAMSESNMRFVKDDNKLVGIVRIAVVLVAFASCLISTALMDLISDTFMALMGAVNIIVVGLLSKKAFALYKDYREQKKAGIEDPVFHKNDLFPDDDGITEWD